MPIECRHCGNENAGNARYCRSCGALLAVARPVEPRTIHVAVPAQADMSRQYLEDEMERQQRRASASIIAVGIFNWIVAAMCFVLGTTFTGLHRLLPRDLLEKLQGAACRDLVASAILYGIVGAIFFALARSSRGRPYSAAVISLIFFMLIYVAEGLQNRQAVASGNIPRFVIIFVLVSGVLAGRRHRRISKQLGI
ncbi:MAG TPA: zinc ribbon domain-containing protein [Phycisphaerae bacterium]|nr:zinc ribbon domain-containing protein [Phycisphaerae bacterium]HRW54468.1 zinc ribbon domain-containing protein [Phycisphaerae bacterium]